MNVAELPSLDSEEEQEEEAISETSETVEEEVIEEVAEEAEQAGELEDDKDPTPSTERGDTKPTESTLSKRVRGIPANTVVPTLSKEEEELVNTPVEEIPETNLFDPAPLVARLMAGAEQVKELADRQTDVFAEKAVSAPVPEARITKVTSSGKVIIQFTSDLDIPAGTLESINESKDTGRRRLEGEQPIQKSHIELYVIKQGEADDDDDESEEPLLEDWSLVSLDSAGCELQMKLTRPLEISQGEDADLVLI